MHNDDGMDGWMSGVCVCARANARTLVWGAFSLSVCLPPSFPPSLLPSLPPWLQGPRNTPSRTPCAPPHTNTNHLHTRHVHPCARTHKHSHIQAHTYTHTHTQNPPSHTPCARPAEAPPCRYQHRCRLALPHHHPRVPPHQPRPVSLQGAPPSRLVPCNPTALSCRAVLLRDSNLESQPLIHQARLERAFFLFSFPSEKITG